MLKRLLYIQILLAVLLGAGESKAQIIQFSQYYAAPLFLAPSYAGVCNGSRISANYRNQWPEVGTFNTYAVAYDQNLYKINSGLGVMVLRDDAGDGDLALTTVDLCYSWWTKITRDWSFRPGISFKYNQRSLNFPDLIFGDQIDEKGNIKSTPTIENKPLPSKPFLDMQVSSIFYSDQYWGGFSVDHLLRPRTSLYDRDDYHEDMKISFFGGAKIYVGAPTTSRGRKNKEDMQNVTFALLYDYSKLSDQLSVGAYWTKNPFTLGAWVRGIPLAIREDSYGNLDAVVLMLGYKIYDLHIGYSYDFSIGELLSSTGGSHEISLMYEFSPKARSKKRHSVIACPKL
ncbi:MAG: PorP/SprF family type IX secretion system membrane protein [Bacteroidales bacterium]|nr:PorP/SprF family type IX secretion system membrane protein [Bacteroidales bacterium]